MTEGRKPVADRLRCACEAGLSRRCRCTVYLAIGLALGWSLLAYAQGPSLPPSHAPEQQTDQMLSFAYLVQSFGLPGVIGYLGWVLGRSGGVPVTITVKTDEELRRVLTSIAVSSNSPRTYTWQAPQK